MLRMRGQAWEDGEHRADLVRQAGPALLAVLTTLLTEIDKALTEDGVPNPICVAARQARTVHTRDRHSQKRPLTIAYRVLNPHIRDGGVPDNDGGELDGVMTMATEHMHYGNFELNPCVFSEHRGWVSFDGETWTEMNLAEVHMTA